MTTKTFPEHLVNLPYHQTLDIRGSKMAFFHRDNEIQKSKINVTTHCISYVVNGNKTVHSMEGELCLRVGEAAFFKKGLYLNTEKTVDQGVYEGITFFLSDQLLKDFIQRHEHELNNFRRKNSTFKLFKIPHSMKIQKYFESLIPYFSDDQRNEALLNLKFDELLLNLIHQDDFEVFKSFLLQINAPKKTSIEEFIQQNYTKNLSLSEYAFLSGMSLSSFKRVFEETFGSAPGKWLKNKRLEKAKYLITYSDKNINEISDETGFSSPSHFIASFKHRYGLPPRQFKVQLDK